MNQRQIELRVDQYGGDNSFFRGDKANFGDWNGPSPQGKGAVRAGGAAQG